MACEYREKAVPLQWAYSEGVLGVACHQVELIC